MTLYAQNPESNGASLKKYMRTVDESGTSRSFRQLAGGRRIPIINHTEVLWSTLQSYALPLVVCCCQSRRVNAGMEGAWC